MLSKVICFLVAVLYNSGTMYETGRYVLITMLFILIGVIVFGVLYTQKQKLDNTLPSVMNPQAALSVTPGPDPEIAAWKTYTNQLYRFSVTVPAAWYLQDYQAMHPSGGTMVAFGPDPLPCGDCSYIKNGYLSLRIFNEKTDPEYYALYATRVKLLGRSKEYKQAVIGDKTGVATDTTVALEQNGWVYEFTLDKNNGNATIEDSPIFNRIVNSITFQEDLL